MVSEQLFEIFMNSKHAGKQLVFSLVVSLMQILMRFVFEFLSRKQVRFKRVF